MIRNLRVTERTEKRLAKVESVFKPRGPAVAIIDEGDPIPQGVKVIIIDNIPREPIVVKESRKV
jgi:precorrin-6B methylase 1